MNIKMSKVEKPDHEPDKTEASLPPTNATEPRITLQKSNDLLINLSHPSSQYEYFKRKGRCKVLSKKILFFPTIHQIQ